MTNINRDPLLRAIFDAAQAVEACGASEALTAAVIAVTAIYQHAERVLDARDAALARAGVAEKDAARLDWIEQMLFERKWSGTIGEPSYWQMAGPYRHTLVRMRGENLRAALDAARTKEQRT